MKSVLFLGSIYGFGAKMGTQGLLSLTFGKWDPSFVIPMSMTDSIEDILIRGEDGVLPMLGFGLAGSWYHPIH